MDFRRGKRFILFIPVSPTLLFLLFSILLQFPNPSLAQTLNPTPPATPVRLVFIHHSVGEGWLTDDFGNLLRELNNNNYFVSDTNYGWGPGDPDPESGAIGDHTDIGYWFNWFLGPQSGTFMPLLYADILLTPGMGANSLPQPAGDNTVVLFKSCFISGYLITGNPSDPPRQSSSGNPNPIWSVGSGNPEYTVSNIKGMYRDLLAYFAAHQDKLFILITTPPSSNNDPGLNPDSPARLRAINTWLVHHWLDNYRYNNVAVFDFYNTLTSNGGDPNTNDLGAVGGNHHRLANGRVQHVIGLNHNVSAYVNGADSHPNAAGDQKATGEFLPLLNVACNAWKGLGGRPLLMGREILPGGGLAARTLLLLD